jgi:SigmaW regulon antibacterial
MPTFIENNWFLLCLLIVMIPLILVVGMWVMRAVLLNLSALKNGINIGVTELLLLNFRHIDTSLLISQLLALKHAGIDMDHHVLASHYMAGGNIRHVTAALVAAKRHQIPLTIERATAIDLIGQDPVQLVSDAVYEASKIPMSEFENPDGYTKQPVNAASVLLQIRPGMTGQVAHTPTLTARARFGSGEADIFIKATRLPTKGDRIRVINVDGITINAELI